MRPSVGQKRQLQRMENATMCQVAETTTTKSETELRAEFRRLRKYAGYGCHIDTQWKPEVERLARKAAGGADPTAEQWVAAAQAARVKCDRCRATGRYSWGACVNGKMTHSGPCFRCGGTGTQGQEDFKRNYGYDCHAIVGAYRGMFTQADVERACAEYDGEERGYEI